jgi:chloramphenicol O-acetyltransferase
MNTHEITAHAEELERDKAETLRLNRDAMKYENACIGSLRSIDFALFGSESDVENTDLAYNVFVYGIALILAVVIPFAIYANHISNVALGAK